MYRWLLLSPVLLAGAFLMLVSRPVHADDATTQPATGSITVTVNDDSGKAVSGAHVSIFAAKPKKAAQDQAKKGGRKGKAVATGDTGDDGTVTLNSIPPGDYNVAVKTDDGARGRGKVTVDAGQTAAVTVTVKAKAAAAN